MEIKIKGILRKIMEFGSMQTSKEVVADSFLLSLFIHH